jgi:hypothetical protein
MYVMFIILNLIFNVYTVTANSKQCIYWRCTCFFELLFYSHFLTTRSPKRKA